MTTRRTLRSRRGKVVIVKGIGYVGGLAVSLLDTCLMTCSATEGRAVCGLGQLSIESVVTCFRKLLKTSAWIWVCRFGS